MYICYFLLVLQESFLVCTVFDIILYPLAFCWKCSRDRQDITIFWDRKSQNQLFFNFFSTKVSDFVSNPNDDCSQLSFEVYNVFVAQKLPISQFLIKLFFAWTLATLATSRGHNLNLNDLNRVSNFS